MVIQDWKVYGDEDAFKAIGLSYNDEFKTISKSFNVATNLVKRGLGSGEANFLTGITASLMVNASIKWWQQAERYHWFQICMSQSVMHMITHRKIEELEFTEETPKACIDAFAERIKDFKQGKIDKLGLIYSVPVGLKEKARVTTNYLQLLNMWKQRHDHKLTEWHQFCEELEVLPLMDGFLDLIRGENNG